MNCYASWSPPHFLLSTLHYPTSIMNLHFTDIMQTRCTVLVCSILPYSPVYYTVYKTKNIFFLALLGNAASVVYSSTTDFKPYYFHTRPLARDGPEARAYKSSPHLDLTFAYPIFQDPNEIKIIYLRATGGEVGASSALAPKIGPLGLVRITLLPLGFLRMLLMTDRTSNSLRRKSERT